jgi:hypothetical protein
MTSLRRVSIISSIALIAIAGFGFITSAQAAAAKAGGSCATAGAKTAIAGKSYTCKANSSKKLVWTAATPTVLGSVVGNGGHPADEGSAADLARHAAMAKYAACITKNGGTANTFGPGGFRGGPDDQNNPQSMPSISAKQKAAMAKCASLRPEFGGPGGRGGFRGGPDDQNGTGGGSGGGLVVPTPSPSASAKA